MIKKRLIVPCVTTWRGALKCIGNGVKIFAVENPLYTQMRGFYKIWQVFLPYLVVLHPEKQVAIFIKNRGKNTFNGTMYELVYPPLEWPHWIS